IREEKMDARVKPPRMTRTEFATAPALQRTTPRKGGVLRCVRGTSFFQLTENFNSLMASKSCTPPPTRLVV
ncbi:MAG: hypothetical protein QOF19_303, partial [Alphaproteobacteria bacterium]|nr:hypothetical protein [Alphaproteobacteria bacterium]